MEAKDFIFKIDNAISENSCKKIIQFFEKNNNKKRIENNGAPNFTELNINQHIKELVSPISSTVVQHLKEYENNFLSFSRYFPSKICLEEFRIKCYDSKKIDRFDIHVDVTDKESSKRMLAFLYYLNEDFCGGETIFPEHDLSIKPKTGSLIMFPPTWQYPHIGSKVENGKKYIMSTYLHYY